MGRWNSGRRPQPPADIKVVRGVPDKRWKKTTIGPDFDTPPKDLEDDDEAQKEWARVVPILRADGYIGHTEVKAIVALCQMWSRYVEAQKAIQTEGLVVLRPSGVEAQNPHIRIADTALNQCRQLWTELGLTPAGRARIAQGTAATPEKQSKWAGLLT